MKHSHFADRLIEECLRKHSRLVVGLDPHPDLLPPQLVGETLPTDTATLRRHMAEAIRRFNAAVIEAVADQAVAVKPQLAFYEQWGPPGLAVYEETVAMAHQAGLIVIADAKRNDIGSTAAAYATAFFGAGPEEPDKADAITVNPYLGHDSIQPFLARCADGKGAFALVRTSNPGSAEIQELSVEGRALYLRIAELVHQWGSEMRGASGYSALGAVVGATDPGAAAALRQALPHTLFLVPGFGAQGGSAANVAAAFDASGLGAVVNSSREILFAYRKQGEPRQFAHHCRLAASEARQAINAAINVVYGGPAYDYNNY